MDALAVSLFLAVNLAAQCPLGEHEATVLTTWMRGANLRRWIKRPDCPKALKQFHSLFIRQFANNIENPDVRPEMETPPRKTALKSGEQAYYDVAGMHFSRAETHVGNSLVSYLENGNIWFGSIEKIKVTPQGSVSFAIRHQEPLPAGKNDPFKAFPHFPARTFSSEMATTLVDVAPTKVLGHYARFNFSDERAVVLDLRRVGAQLFHSDARLICVGLMSRDAPSLFRVFFICSICDLKCVLICCVHCLSYVAEFVKSFLQYWGSKCGIWQIRDRCLLYTFIKRRSLGVI
jgi:hypothetical protein